MARLTYEKLMTPTLLRRFVLESLEEGGNGQFYACVMRDNYDLVVEHPASPALDPAQLLWVRDVLHRLNKELHHDGAWVAVFTHPKAPALETVLHNLRHVEYARYGLIWVDEDGDPQFTQEWVNGENSDFKDWSDVLLAGIVSTMQKAETSWETWRMSCRVLDRKKEQTFARAQGETAPSLRH